MSLVNNHINGTSVKTQSLHKQWWVRGCCCCWGGSRILHSDKKKYHPLSNREVNMIIHFFFLFKKKKKKNIAPRTSLFSPLLITYSRNYFSACKHFRTKYFMTENSKKKLQKYSCHYYVNHLIYLKIIVIIVYHATS